MLRVGEVFVYGRDRETARRLIAAARATGIDQRTVRATDSGFIVPGEVFDQYENAQAPVWAAEDAIF